MSLRIQTHRFVELTYRILDQKTGDVLTGVEFPIGYVHGKNTLLDPRVMAELEGKQAGATISVHLDCTDLYGARDESLVFTDWLENVPEEYREVGTQILMENDKGETKRFLVTRMDDKTLTVDGNHPLCGRQAVFELKILNVREATEEEIAAGGKCERGPEIGDAALRPI